ncbi:MAG: FtsX-like permease family protein [Corynebacteriales bacterium]|nr:FtsX-like permease family protein [Mycobacteriales bacterium]
MLRAIFKSLLSRKLRLLLSGFAVVLGVMAVSGAFVLSDTLTKSFDDLFATANKNLDVQITGNRNVGDGGGDSFATPVPEKAVATVKDVPGVKKAEGSIGLNGARVVDKDNGKVIGSQGPPRLGIAWTGETDLMQIAEGTAPKNDKEVIINQGLAKKGDFKVGDTIDVLTLLQPKSTYTVSGIFELSGGRESLGGETYVGFTLAEAQRVMLGQSDAYSAIDVEANDGVSQTQLKADIENALGGAYTVKTGDEVADEQKADVEEFLSIFRNVLLGFAGVALFVGIFLILNTFSIIVAQRTKELALFRAMGASRRQIMWTVLLEAIVIGVIASFLGFLAGLGVAAGLKALVESSSGSALPGSGLSIPPIAIIASFTVGIIVTLIAAVVPALRAARIAPIAAMRQAADTQKPLRKITIAGAILTALGMALMGWGLFGDASIWALLGGVLFTYIGVAMLTPSIAKPVIDVVGRVFSWSLPGKLGRRNSARNPRRTAITAAALMVGISLIAGVTVLGSSIKTSFAKLVSDGVKAELLIIGDLDGGEGARPTYDPAVIDEVKALPDVAYVTPYQNDNVELDGNEEFASAADWTTMQQMIDVEGIQGEFRDLKPGEIIVDDKMADELDLKVGSTVGVATNRKLPGSNDGGVKDMTVVGIYDQSEFLGGLLLSEDDAKAGFSQPQPSEGYIKLKDGADVNVVKDQVDDILANNPEVSAQTQGELVEQGKKQIDQLLIIIYILLALAIVIAVLGVINTLALSILERTRELGLLRAVGLTRAQTMRMVTVESIVIAVFGSLLGIVVGCGLGTAIVKALKDDGISELDFPWTRLIIFLIIAIVVGLFAAIIPAIKAARTNVLRAISYE